MTFRKTHAKVIIRARPPKVAHFYLKGLIFRFAPTHTIVISLWPTNHGNVIMIPTLNKLHLYVLVTSRILVASSFHSSLDHSACA